MQRAYLITFHTYGTWLHGDERGSTDRDHNTPGAPPLATNTRRMFAEQGLARHGPVTLDAGRRAIVRSAVNEVCAHRGWGLLAINVRTNHVHAVVRAAEAPEKVMNDFKVYSTRRMREAGELDASTKPWSRHGSTRWLNSDASLAAAIEYVLHGQGVDLDGHSSVAGTAP